MGNSVELNTVLTGAGAGILVPLVNKILGPAADEIGLILSDRIRTFRLKKQIDLFARTQEMLDQAGVDAKKVNLKILLPLLENASLEEDDSLSEKWAALLANAADATNRVEVKPVFTEILKQMVPGEAQLLNRLFQKIGLERETALKYLIKIEEIMDVDANIEFYLDSLTRNRLLVDGYAMDYGMRKPGGYVYFTSLGLGFIQACSPPKPDK